MYVVYEQCCSYSGDANSARHKCYLNACARAHACTRARARVRVCACARAFVCVRVQVCLRVRVSEAEVARLFTSDPRAHTCAGVCMRTRQKLY